VTSKARKSSGKETDAKRNMKHSTLASSNLRFVVKNKNKALSDFLVFIFETSTSTLPMNTKMSKKKISVIS
jgi:hypothetical protein